MALEKVSFQPGIGYICELVWHHAMQSPIDRQRDLELHKYPFLLIEVQNVSELVWRHAMQSPIDRQRDLELHKYPLLVI